MRILKKIFIFSLSTAFAVMLITQILLKNNDIKTNLSKLYKYEAQYVYSEKDIADGYIVVQPSNPSDKLYLLQNGEKIATLNKEKNQINISDNSVIEIDGREIAEKCTVKIIDLSKNISGFYEESVAVQSNIQILGRFFIK